jgi:hypothetical protein
MTEGQSSIGTPDMPVPIDRIAPNTRAGRRRDRRVRRRLARRRYRGQQPVPSRIHRHDGRASRYGAPCHGCASAGDAARAIEAASDRINFLEK